MGIYIKGVDPPTNCTDCYYMPLVGCNPYQDNGLSPSDHRHRTCPLTEVSEPSGDLISRADAIRWVKTECNPYGLPTLDYDSGLKVMEHLVKMPSKLPSTEPKTWKQTPTIDSVEVVRCRDCKNRARYAVCDFLGEDGFCSHGERREDDEV